MLMTPQNGNHFDETILKNSVIVKRVKNHVLKVRLFHCITKENLIMRNSELKLPIYLKVFTCNKWNVKWNGFVGSRLILINCFVWNLLHSIFPFIVPNSSIAVLEHVFNISTYTCLSFLKN